MRHLTVLAMDFVYKNIKISTGTITHIMKTLKPNNDIYKTSNVCGKIKSIM